MAWENYNLLNKPGLKWNCCGKVKQIKKFKKLMTPFYGENFENPCKKRCSLSGTFRNCISHKIKVNKMFFIQKKNIVMFTQKYKFSTLYIYRKSQLLLKNDDSHPRIYEGKRKKV